jgi:hypothetical protein
MPASVPRAVVLGPQPGRVSLGPGLKALDLPAGPVAAITVGWRETEPVLKEVERELEACGREAIPLHIGERVGKVFESDAPLAEAHRALQEGLLAEERLYGARLRRAVETAHEVVRLSVAERYRDPYAEQAWQDILAADRFHVERHAELWQEFREAVDLHERPAIREETEELRRLLSGAVAVVLTGGHVAVIRNRLLLLGLRDALTPLPVLAWSAGAMVLTPRVVLFHDRLPGGSARPEILGDGLSLLPGVALFPDARIRLDLEDRQSLSELAGRVAPERAVLLEPGDAIRWDGRGWSAPNGIRLLSEDGEVQTVPSFVPAGARPESAEAGAAT